MKKTVSLLFVLLFIALCLVPGAGLALTGGAKAGANEIALKVTQDNRTPLEYKITVNMEALEEEESETEENYTLEYAVELAKKLIENGEKPTAAAKSAAEMTGFKKNEIYRELL